MIHGHKLVLARLFAAALALTSCAFDGASPADRQSEPAGQGREALTCDPAVSDTCCDTSKYESCWLQSEGPGSDVKVKFYQCPASPTRSSNYAGCEVEPGWTVIAGGAQILDAATDRASLTLSFPKTIAPTFPEDDMKGAREWRFASASVDGTSHPHRIRPWALGIKLKGYDNVTHFAPVKVKVSGWTEVQARPSAATTVGSSRILLGGGYEIWPSRPSCDGWAMALSEAFTDGDTWRTTASNLGRCSQGRIQNYAISIAACPDQWSGSCFSAQTLATTNSSWGTGIRTASVQDPTDSYLLVGAGIRSSDGRRPLDLIQPVPQLWVNLGVKVSTSGAASGFVTGQGIYLRR